MNVFVKFHSWTFSKRPMPETRRDFFLRVEDIRSFFAVPRGDSVGSVVLARTFGGPTQRGLESYEVQETPEEVEQLLISAGCSTVKAIRPQ